MGDLLYKTYLLREEDYIATAGSFDILNLELLQEIFENKKCRFVGLDNENYYMVDHWICKSTVEGLIIVDDAFSFLVIK